jgi:hypothetical protein
MSQVILVVYDLHPKNDWGYQLGLGIFHSGVEINGVEITFGGHDLDRSGIYDHAPGSPGGLGMVVPIRCKVPLGSTTMTRTQILDLAQSMGNQWKGRSYHLLRKNCNHFTDEFSKRLVGRGAPGWVNRMAWWGKTCECILPLDRLLGQAPPEPPPPVSDDLETAWGGTAFRLSDVEPTLVSEDESDKRSLLADAASRRLLSANNDSDI